MQLCGERGELPELLRRAGPGLLGPGAQDRRHELLDEVGIEIPDEQEDEVEKFREFLDQISPEDFGAGSGSGGGPA